MPIKVTREQLYARLASEARAVLTPEQIIDMAASMDLRVDEVEDQFSDAEDLYEAVKDRIIVLGIDED